MNEVRWFLTVDWCNQGRRGVLCDEKGRGFWSPFPMTPSEIVLCLGTFHVILYPESLPFLEEEFKRLLDWYPLEEYSGKLGYAAIPGDVLATVKRRRDELLKGEA